MSGDLTLVLQSWKKRRRNHRVLFGEPTRKIRLDWHRCLLSFKPGIILGYERWDANKYGTQNWSICILQTARAGDAISKIHGVNPGAVQLAKATGTAACKTWLRLLDELKSLDQLQRLSPVQWQLMGHRLRAGMRAEIVLADVLEFQ